MDDYIFIRVTAEKGACTTENKANKVSLIQREQKFCQKIGHRGQQHGDVQMIHIDKSMEM